jgi:transcriptional regulator with XRE-family HTH domain
MGSGGDRIRISRILKNFSQFELAKRAGCSYSLVSLVERGHTARPETMKRIEAVLDLKNDQEGGEDGA